LHPLSKPVTPLSVFALYSTGLGIILIDRDIQFSNKSIFSTLSTSIYQLVGNIELRYTNESYFYNPM
jgi:hypothetical protein